MLGKQSSQSGLYSADSVYLEHVGRDSFYASLATLSEKTFPDEQFAELFRDKGRPSVPPSQLCVALLLQAHDVVSDEEAINRTAYDLRWKVALRLNLDEKLCAKSTLQRFRAQLVLHKKFEEILERSVGECRRAGLLSGDELEVAVDTTPILGRGAVKDTYNLLADQIQRVVKATVKLKSWNLDEVIETQRLTRYFGTSFKGEAELDWDAPEQKRALLEDLLADGRRALSLAREALRGFGAGSVRARRLREASALLSELLLQDIDEDPDDGDGPKIRQGTARDRVVSTTDPEMRHGRKSSSKTFKGYKASVAADTGHGVILSTDVLPGNAHDSEGAAELLSRASEYAGRAIDRGLGDTSYGSAPVRKKLSAVVEEVVAKVPPASHRKGRFSVDDFRISDGLDEAVCPAGKKAARRSNASADGEPAVKFTFSQTDCQACPLRESCTSAKARQVTVSQVTRQNQALRQQQRTKEFKAKYRRRVVVERKIGRLVQLGIRQARFFGRLKTKFQVAFAATVANLKLATG